jgi:hypothetical protein
MEIKAWASSAAALICPCSNKVFAREKRFLSESGKRSPDSRIALTKKAFRRFYDFVVACFPVSGFLAKPLDKSTRMV